MRFLLPELKDNSDKVEVRKALLDAEKSINDKNDSQDAQISTNTSNIATNTSNLSILDMIGSIQMYAGSTAPNTYWKICNGSAISRKEFSELYSIIGITYGAGDGTTTFNLPDFQGRSPKGVGTSSGGTDVTHVAETVTLALKQNDRMQGHYHAIGGVGASAGGSFTAFASGTGQVNAPITDGTNGTPRTGTITTGKCLGINFIIRVK